MMNATQSTAKQRLAVRLLSDREIQMERTFDAPRHLVWKAFTDAELIPKWWGRTNTTTRVDKLELRPGGAWRFVESEQDGTEHAFRGEYTAVSPVEKLAYTFEYEPMAGHVVHDTIRLEELGELTKVVTVAAFASQEDRDGMMQAGMEEGANESYDRLDELLATLK